MEVDREGKGGCQNAQNLEILWADKGRERSTNSTMFWTSDVESSLLVALDEVLLAVQPQLPLEFRVHLLSRTPKVD